MRRWLQRRGGRCIHGLRAEPHWRCAFSVILLLADGYNDVADDASMGWARYAHSMRVFVLNSGLFYIRWVFEQRC